MTSRWASAAALALMVGPSLAGQQVREIGAGVVMLGRDPVTVVAGPYVGLRTTSRTRVAATAGAGVSGSALAWRGELAVHFLLAPGNRTGAGLYGGGGLALGGSDGDVHGWVLLLVGLEGRPGVASGGFIEAGLGGGPRLAAGWRWRARRH